MKYILFRFLDYNINGAACKYCKKPLPVDFTGLSYRDGNGKIITHKFHDACAALQEPNLTLNFITLSSDEKQMKRIDDLKKTVQNVSIDQSENPLDEYNWWDSGHFYRIMLNRDSNATCGLSGEKIEMNVLIIEKPVINYGNKDTVIFRLENALEVTGFDWGNFDKRLRVSFEKSAENKDELLLALKRFNHSKILERIAELERDKFQIYGLEVERCKKDLLCWDVYFKKQLSESEQRKTVAILEKFHCTFSDKIHLEIRPSKTLKTKEFRENGLAILETLPYPVFAAHFCKRGDYRMSRALTREQNGLVPYPFMFFNHDGFKNSFWELYVRFKRPLKTIPRGFDNKPYFFSKHWLNENLMVSNDHFWIKTSRGYWEGIDKQIEDELYDLHDQYHLEMVVLNDLYTAASESKWSQWSFQSISKDQVEVFSQVRKEFKGTHQRKITEFNWEETLNNASGYYEHACEMGDPGSGLEGLLDLIEEIPFEFRNGEKYKKVITWRDELIEIISGGI